MPMKLTFQPFEMPMQALALLAGPVILYHAGLVEGYQDFIAKGLVYLSIRYMGRIYGPYLAALT